MARHEPDVIVTASVLDRLIDDNPGTRADPQITTSQSMRHFKTALKRDLEWLLNTRRTPEPAPDTLEHAAASIINFGLPDITSISVQSGSDRSRLLQLMESVVRNFEPRITSPRVTMDPVNPNTRNLVFRIEGTLVVDPAPEQVSFDTVLEIASGEYEVK